MMTKPRQYRMTLERAMEDAQRQADETGTPRYVKSEVCGGTERFYVGLEPERWDHYGLPATKVTPRVRS